MFPVKFYKAQTHRLAFDSDFRVQFVNKLHGGNGSLYGKSKALSWRNSTTASIPTAASGLEGISLSRTSCAFPLPLRVICISVVRYHRLVLPLQRSQTVIMPKKNEAPASFETALSELEHIVTRTESGDLPLEDAE